MKVNFQRGNIADLEGYVSGEQRDDVDLIKLNTNENAYPASPLTQQLLTQISIGDLRRYPQPTSDGFRQEAAALHGIKAENIIATRGGDELLRLLLTTFVDPGAAVGMTDLTYSLYPILTRIQDARPFSVPLTDNWLLPTDFSDQINAESCQLTFVVNPHAPTGILTRAAELIEISKNIKGLLVIDEAYVNFIGDPDYDLSRFAAESENVVLLRTLSKGYGLAGLRFGYGIGPRHLIEPMLHKTRDSYNLDAISQALATVAIKDQAYARDNWHKISQHREDLVQQLRQIGFDCLPSQANFVLATVPQTSAISADLIYQGLKAHNILVRYFPDERLADKLRITVGRPEEHARLMTALSQLLDSHA